MSFYYYQVFFINSRSAWMIAPTIRTRSIIDTTTNCQVPGDNSVFFLPDQLKDLPGGFDPQADEGIFLLIVSRLHNAAVRWAIASIQNCSLYIDNTYIRGYSR